MATIKELHMAWPDFIGGLMSCWGARLDSDRAWLLPNGLGVSLVPRPCDPHVEHGWHRWQLPGFDGVTRGRLIDRNAPFVVRSPNRRWFWCIRDRIQPMHWRDLIEVAAEHAVNRGAARGWPARTWAGAIGTVCTEVGGAA